jgi:hypothetical protein
MGKRPRTRQPKQGFLKSKRAAEPTAMLDSDDDEIDACKTSSLAPLYSTRRACLLFAIASF